MTSRVTHYEGKTDEPTAAVTTKPRCELLQCLDLGGDTLGGKWEKQPHSKTLGCAQANL